MFEVGRIVGAQDTLDHIWRNLMDEEHRIIALVGMKGVEKVQDEIWETIGDFDSNWVHKSFHEKSASLAQILSLKKFLLILDSVWEPFRLSDIGVPCVEPGTKINNFKVIFTSHSEPVCRSLGGQAIIRVNVLQEAAAWKLFKENLGEYKFDDPEILKMAKLIARKCQGWPLALCTVARCMAGLTTYKDWKYALQEVQLSSYSGFVFYDHIVAMLSLTFDSLPSDMAGSYIIYFSLFPEDYSIPKNELIDFWICEQLLGHQQDVLNVGYNTLETLTGSSLLLEEQNYVSLHDMIHDYALSLAFKSQLFKNAQLIEAMDDKALETVGWIAKMTDSVQNTASVPPKFATFLLYHNPFIWIKGKFSQFMDALTVLVLSHSGVEEVPREISKMPSLQYLNLSHTWIYSLPIELKMLTKLKCLNLEHNCQLRVLPKKLIYSLSSLQVLKMFRCGFFVEELGDNILSVRNMDIDHLQVLSITIACNSALEKLFCSPKLTSCMQSLSLEVFWGSELLDISPLLAMKNLLILEIHNAENLRKLIIDTELLRERSFERLEEVTIESSSSLQELTWVALAQNLEILRVKRCEQMKEIISTVELGGISLEPFAKLEILELENLRELKSISQKVLHFWCLKKMKIVYCSLLRELPLNRDTTKTNEMVIEAEEDWWANAEWEDDATRTTFQKFFRPLKIGF